MAIEQRPMAFSYASLAPDVRARVETATARLHDLERRTSESIIEMGQHLIEVKAAIGHGNFLPWLEAEFGWTRQTAHNLMQVAERFANVKNLDISPSALYILAAPSTSDEVRIEFTELAKMGQHVTHKAVKERIDEVKKPTWQAPKMPTRRVDDDGDVEDDEDDDSGFVCDECGEIFSVEVWHCPQCDHHWSDGDDTCKNCYRPREGFIGDEDDESTPEAGWSVVGMNVLRYERLPEPHQRARALVREIVAHEGESFLPHLIAEVEKHID